MSEQNKRSFPYYSAVPSIDLKRRAVEGINPGQESSSPVIFHAPALAEVEGVSLHFCQTLLGVCAVDRLTAADICRCHALGHEHCCSCSSLEQLTSQAGLMTKSRYAHTSMPHCVLPTCILAKTFFGHQMLMTLLLPGVPRSKGRRL